MKILKQFCIVPTSICFHCRTLLSTTLQSYTINFLSCSQLYRCIYIKVIK